MHVSVTFQIIFLLSEDLRIMAPKLEAERSPIPSHPIHSPTDYGNTNTISCTRPLPACCFVSNLQLHSGRPTEAMARVTILVAVITIAVAGHLVAVTHAKPFTSDLTIQNNFQAYNLTVQCDSDLEAYPDSHLVLPTDMYQISFDAHIPQQWTCTLSTEVKLCGKASYKGRFIMWQNHMPIPPMREPMCEDHGRCPWFVDAHGLSLIRHPGGEPMLVYDWPAQKHLGPHC